MGALIRYIGFLFAVSATIYSRQFVVNFKPVIFVDTLQRLLLYMQVSM